MKKVLVFGSYDILHPGHIHFFKQARKLGDYLIVVVARDENIERVKGLTPVNEEAERLREVQELRIVDKAILGNKADPYQIIEEVKPDIICLGYDQESFVPNLDAEMKKRGVKAEVVRLEPYRAEQYKSSKLRDDLN